MQNSKFKIISFVSVIAAIVVSIYLTAHHYQLQYSMRDGKSFCSQSGSIDCDSVNISSFSEFMGIPVALLGAFAFLVQFLFLLGIYVLGEDEKSKPRRLFLSLTIFNLVFCVYLALASWFVLKTFCLYCFLLYVLCLLLFFCAYKLKDEESLKFKKLFTEDIKSLPIIILLALIPLGSLFVHASVKNSIAEDLDKVVDAALYQWKENKKYDFYLADAPAMGAESPLLTLVVFSDFQCPYCKKSAPSLHAFVNAHKKKVRLVYQNYPLDASCNPKMQNSVHKESCFFTKAVLCAKEQNQYIHAHDWIFEHQSSLSQSSLDIMIADLKLDGTELKQCMEQNKTNQEILEQIKRAESAEIKGTPSIFANGKFLPYGSLIPVLEKVLKELETKNPIQ